ncbi:MAG: DUF3575 domain-containing protein [Bacteroidota bacterium]|nr:DUF3575 domain-containing protein [Bacteroidota bacterium]
MKYFYLLIVFLFCTYFANAQLIADNYKIVTDISSKNDIAGFQFPDESSLKSSGLNGAEINKRRRRQNKYRKGPDNIIKTNLTNLIYLSPTLAYEKILSSNISLGGSLSYSHIRIKQLKMKFTGPKICFDFKYYVTQNAPTGFFIGAFTYFNSYTLVLENQFYVDPITNETLNEFIANLKNYGLGAIWGYQFITNFGMAINLYSGFGGGGSTLKIKQGQIDEFDISILDTYTFRGGVSIGWAF